MHRLVAAIVVCAIATLVSAETYWVPAVATDHLDDLLQHDPPSIEEGVPPPGSNPVFDLAVMPEIAQWGEGQRLMFIYGQ